MSDGLVELLVQSREAYCWSSKNKGKGPCSDNEREVSQREVLHLEEPVAALVADLNPESGYMIALKVYEWGGGGGERPARRDGTEFEKAIRMLLAKEAATGLELLTTQRRIDLVMATKVYRFCCPKVGAAVDRHASYFFNSLPVNTDGRWVGFATSFQRRWKDGSATKSRLQSYSPYGRPKAQAEFLKVYLPLVAGIAENWNGRERMFTDAATGEISR